MSTERVIATNLRIAPEDLAGARLLAAANNRNAAYLAEQCAEKIIRAVLTSEGIHGGIGHALTQMVESLPPLYFMDASYKSKATSLLQKIADR